MQVRTLDQLGQSQVADLRMRRSLKRMVGERGFEPPTPWSRISCSMNECVFPICQEMLGAVTGSRLYRMTGKPEVILKRRLEPAIWKVVPKNRVNVGDVGGQVPVPIPLKGLGPLSGNRELAASPSAFTSLELFVLAMVRQGLATPYDLKTKAGLSLGSTVPALARLEKDSLVEASDKGAQ